jgi:serine/threonine protein kinase
VQNHQFEERSYACLNPSRCLGFSTPVNKPLLPRYDVSAGPDSLAAWIPDHELLRCIGRGTYGEVWLARNAVGTPRAVKIVRRDRFDHAVDFEREFKGLQCFEPVSRTHEGLTDILSLGHLPGADGFFYVMELADDACARSELSAAEVDPTLDTLPRSKPKSGELSLESYSPLTLRVALRDHTAFPFDRLLDLGLKMTAAVAHLHEHGLVHRDIKPSNILFVGGEPKLADAGLVAAVDDARSLVGTAGYIAPEGPGSAQADLYALGKVLYEAAFGKDRQEFPELPLDLRSRPDHARLLEFNAILLKACATDSRGRYQSARPMQADLELLKRGKSVKRQRTLQRVWTVCKTTGLATALITLVVIGIIQFTRDEADKYPKSSKAEVNNLVKQGHDLLRFEIPAQIAQAERKFKRAAEVDPSFVPAQFGLHDTYFRLGDSQARRKVAQKLVELAPNSAEARGAVAGNEYEDGNFQKALELTRQASELPAHSREAEAYKHLGYGYLLQESGDSTNALRQYEIATKLLPIDPTLLDHIGQPYMMQGNYTEAEKHFRRSIELQPDHANGHRFLARLFEQTGRFKEAISEWEVCYRLDGEPETEIRRFFDALRDAFRQRGARGYWETKLEEAQKQSPPQLDYMATLHARLAALLSGPAAEQEKDKAYALLEKICEQHEPCGAMDELCWDHNDPKFRAIMKRCGLIR